MQLGLYAALWAIAAATLLLTGFALYTARHNNDTSNGPPSTGQWWRKNHRRLAIAVLAGLIVWWWTSWPVLALAVGLLIWHGRTILGTDHKGKRAIARLEAVASWTETLRDVLASAAGLEQAIVASARFAPPAIELEVRNLGQALTTGVPMDEALYTFARDVDDETCDLVAIGLIRAWRRSGDLTALLTRLADTARDDASVRTHVIASRASVRTSTRMITITTLAMVAALVTLNPDFMAAYDTATGQIVLAAILTVFAVAFRWMYQLSRYQPPERLINIGGVS